MAQIDIGPNRSRVDRNVTPELANVAAGDGNPDILDTLTLLGEFEDQR
jgi:hypothetical protein